MAQLRKATKLCPASFRPADEAEAGRESRCPRCGGAFHCGVADVLPCACFTLRLDAALLADLRTRYDRCLCLVCLVQLQQEASPPQ
jgi:hypothetical protein